MPRIAGSKTKLLKLDKIRLDGDTQSRIELDQDVIRDYADQMSSKVEFPPLLVVFDGASYWLVDGFHRRWAAIKAKLQKFKCAVVQGTRDDARWMSYAVNKDHGLPRSTADKQKAVIQALKHPNGEKKSDSQIAAHVGVAIPTVSRHRKQLESTLTILKSPERAGRDGRTINTANIGKSRPGRATGLPSRPPKVDLTPQPTVNGKHKERPEPTAFDHLKYWWNEANETQRCLFRNWIDGKL